MDDDWLPPPGAPPLPRTVSDLQMVAREQCGLLTRSQCLGAGMTPKAVQKRLESGRWEPVHRGVYQTRPGRQDWWTRATAALLACGPRSAWSHGTAAFAWGIGPVAPPARLELVVPRTGSVRSVNSAAVGVHRSAFVAERVHDHVWPWRTTVEDTILDVGGQGTLDGQLAVLARAFQKGLATEWTVAASLERRATHRWRRVLGELLGEVAAGSESPLEVRFVRDVLRPHGLPVGTRQLARVDAAAPTRPNLHDLGYPEQRVLVELDGRLGHEGYAGRLKDGVRDRRGLVAGWVTFRAFWLDVAGRPCALAGEVGDVLRSRGWTGEVRACRSRTCAVGHSRGYLTPSVSGAVDTPPGASTAPSS